MDGGSLRVGSAYQVQIRDLITDQIVSTSLESAKLRTYKALEIADYNPKIVYTKRMPFTVKIQIRQQAVLVESSYLRPNITHCILEA